MHVKLFILDYLKKNIYSIYSIAQMTQHNIYIYNIGLYNTVKINNQLSISILFQTIMHGYIKNLDRSTLLIRFLKILELDALTTFSGREFHAAKTRYAKEDLWMLDLSFGVERWREWLRGDVLFGNLKKSMIRPSSSLSSNFVQICFSVNSRTTFSSDLTRVTNNGRVQGLFRRIIGPGRVPVQCHQHLRIRLRSRIPQRPVYELYSSCWNQFYCILNIT